MRASKENAEKAIQAVHKTMPPGMPKDLVMEFLKAAKAKLPTEKETQWLDIYFGTD